jgi:hypothetical protein
MSFILVYLTFHTITSIAFLNLKQTKQNKKPIPFTPDALHVQIMKWESGQHKPNSVKPGGYNHQCQAGEAK